MSFSISKKGFIEHLFDILAGIILAFIAAYIISTATAYDNENTQTTLRDASHDSYAQRQLVRYLETTVPFHGEHKRIWELLIEGKQHLGIPPELLASTIYNTYSDDYTAINDATSDIFNPLFGQDKWFLLIDYATALGQVQINFQPNYVDHCVAGVPEGILHTYQLAYPSSEGQVILTLHSCMQL